MSKKPPRKQGRSEAGKRQQYEAQKAWIYEKRAQGRDIGPIPAVANERRRKKCAKDLLAFARAYCAARFPLPFSADHLRVIDLLQRAVLEGGQAAIAMPRGSGKTTLIEVAALWALVYGHRRFVVVIGADSGAADKVIESVRSELECNEVLGEDFPEVCFPIRALEGIPQRARQQTSGGERTDMVWTRHELRLPKMATGGGSVVRGAGITGRIRGAKASMSDGSQVRPDLVLLDDPQTDESAKSASQVETRWNVVRNTLLGLAGPGQKIACLAAVTVIVRKDLADRMLDRVNHPEWQGVRARLMNAMPKRVDLWDEYAAILRDGLRHERGSGEATEFYRKHREAMDSGAIAAWPERHDSTELSAIQHAMNLRIVRGDEAFAAEFQNEPLDPLASSDVEQITPEIVVSKLNRHARGIVPIEDTIITGFVDVGKNVLHWMVVAWNPGFGGDIIDYGTSPDQGRAYFMAREAERTIEKAHPGVSWNAAFVAVATDLMRSIMGREWKRDDGSVARCEYLMMDANWGDSTDTVYQFCRRSEFSSLLLPSHGRGFKAGEKSIDEWQKRPGDRTGLRWRIPANSKRQTRHAMFDAGWWKTFIAARLLAPAGTTSCLSLFGDNPGAHRLLADHLSAEYRTRVSANGRTADEWRAKPGMDNHWFDCLVGCAVAASIRGVKLDDSVILRRREQASVDASRASMPAVVRRVAQPISAPSSGGWLDSGSSGGWL